LVTWVVPLEMTLKSLKVDLVIEVGLIFSEKVAATLVPRPMPVPVGVAVLTLGFMVSSITVDPNSKEPMSQTTLPSLSPFVWGIAVAANEDRPDRC
jgi:hypothetical protein